MNKNNKCPECGDPIIGRVDKKFCSDICRANYHNRINREDTMILKKVNAILRKNRNILKSLNPEGKTTIRIDYLLAKGFNFNFYTHIYTTKKGDSYYFVYEYGYLKIKNDYYVLVREEKLPGLVL